MYTYIYMHIPHYITYCALPVGCLCPWQGLSHARASDGAHGPGIHGSPMPWAWALSRAERINKQPIDNVKAS